MVVLRVVPVLVLLLLAVIQFIAGSNSYNKQDDLQICNYHDIETISIKVSRVSNKQEEKTASTKMDIPVAIGEKSNVNHHVQNKESGGVGNSRSKQRTRKRFESQADEGNDYCRVKLMLGDAYDQLDEERKKRENNILVEKKLPKSVNKF